MLLSIVIFLILRMSSEICLSIEQFALGVLFEAFSAKIADKTVWNIRTTAQRCYVCDIVHCLSDSGRTCTLRSLYYRSLTYNAGLIPSQTTINKQVDFLRCTLSCTRRGNIFILENMSLDLGVFATAKGLVSSGNFSTVLSFEGGSSLDMINYAEGLVISADIAQSRLCFTEAKRVLIVEKDTIFQVIAFSFVLKVSIFVLASNS